MLHILARHIHLLRGIEKVVSKSKDLKLEKQEDKSSKKTNESNVATIVEPLLKRARIFKDNGNYDQEKKYLQKAIQSCEKNLDKDPEYAEAYLYKLVAEKGCLTIDELFMIFGLDELEQEESYIFFKKFANNELIKIGKPPALLGDS